MVTLICTIGLNINYLSV